MAPRTPLSLALALGLAAATSVCSLSGCDQEMPRVGRGLQRESDLMKEIELPVVTGRNYPRPAVAPYVFVSRSSISVSNASRVAGWGYLPHLDASPPWWRSEQTFLDYQAEAGLDNALVVDDVLVLAKMTVPPHALRDGPKTLHVQPLFDSLARIISIEKRGAALRKEPFDGRLSFGVDRRVPTHLYHQALYTGRQAQMDPRPQVLVKAPDGVRSLPLPETGSRGGCRVSEVEG